MFGEAFVLPEQTDDRFYLAASLLRRIDGQSALDYNSSSNKKLVVKDSKLAPKFRTQPEASLVVATGQHLDINFSDVIDPENEVVYVNVKLRKALMFASFDQEEMRVVVNSDMIPGEYPITIEYGEIIDEIRMPPQIFEMNLTIVPPELAPPPPPPKTKLPPKGKITDFMMNGRLKIKFRDVKFPEGVLQSQIDIKSDSVPLRTDF